MIQELEEALAGKTIKSVEVTHTCILIWFEDGTFLSAASSDGDELLVELENLF